MQERTKPRLRATLLETRQNLPPGQILEDSARIRDRLLGLDRFRNARSVMLYLPARGEVDTWPLLDHFWKLGCEVLLPRCREKAPGHMDVHAVLSREQLAPGHFGLTEPRPDMATLVNSPEPDAILVPALGYDRRGYRIGFGGGYYDRFLAALPELPVLIGPAFSFQLLEWVPADPWDIPVHFVTTPEKTVRTNLES